ncbi:Hsp20 family protein [Aristophania vespae]|uniref:Hsp20 family protein n=1 Tax=Aristophania vespae TaxID=2697033 RepID=A0A6P1NGB8_9PROT|nr:Hsp20 family protein [Aristophania vespae]QHI95534.1 Hsp20 family protein [Aristophania vespae]UMM63188.1 Small heat shock protein IbpA [Aristophania vespae]
MDYDFAPLFRSAIGFDRMIRLAGNAANAQSPSSYPPYNIEKTNETDYALTMAIAGFSSDDLDITLEDNNLVIRGNIPENNKQHNWLYRGIATRAFERRFTLADHTEVEEACLENGLLTIKLRRLLPEATKPRRIPILNVATGHYNRDLTDEQNSQLAHNSTIQAA